MITYEADYLVIGSGPASIFFTLKKLQMEPSAKIIILEKSRRINDIRNVSSSFLGGCAKSNVTLFYDSVHRENRFSNDTLQEFISLLSRFSSSQIKINNFSFNKKFKSSSIELIGSMYSYITESQFSKIGDEIYKYIDKNTTYINKATIQCIIDAGDEHHVIFNDDSKVKAKKLIIGVGAGIDDFIKDVGLTEYSQADSFTYGVVIDGKNYLFSDLTKAPFSMKIGEFKTSFVLNNCAPDVLMRKDTMYVDIFSNSKYTVKNHTAFSLYKEGPSSNAEFDQKRMAQLMNLFANDQGVHGTFKNPLQYFLKSGHKKIFAIPELQELLTPLKILVETFPELAKAYISGPTVFKINNKKYDVNEDYRYRGYANIYLIGSATGNDNSFVSCALSGIECAKRNI